MNWKYTDASRKAVYRVLANGNIESCLVAAIPPPAGTIDAEDPPAPPTQDEIDATAAKAYAKLNALKNMTPAQVQTWVTANVTNLAQAQDAIMTLAIAVSILARRL